MSRPVIWVTPNSEHRKAKRELAQDNHKLTDMDRVALAELGCLLFSNLIVADTGSGTTHDVTFRGIPLRGMTQPDMIAVIQQVASSMRDY